MPRITATQGRYLLFIHAYMARHGCAPAESDIAAALCVTPPSVNQMMRTLEKKGLILRDPGVPRSIRLLVSAEDIPGARRPRPDSASSSGPARVGQMAPLEIERLSRKERLTLIEQIWNSLTAEDLGLTATQHEELARRLDDAARNPDQAMSWSEAQRHIRQGKP